MKGSVTILLIAAMHLSLVSNGFMISGSWLRFCWFAVMHLSLVVDWWLVIALIKFGIQMQTM
jgi:hypothetical protein